ncbi:NAD(P)-dependent oxidoreductase [Phytoactinopolyspora limicola]|uniref:NAD(P)-dependent oxidoreductase n=1 Tax=Phytoactinopolyspora limicola TaxID=2715536 RepID=UPI001408E136|nr:NAD(P)-binding domain-containing protein [Phytoactinopolyspora limicola]
MTGSNVPVTILGLGPMGSSLARAFVAAGHRTTVWNRTPSKQVPLVAAGAEPAETVAEAVAASPLVIVCVIDNEVAASILGQATTELSGTTVVNLTSDSPDRARQLAAWAAEHGIGYLDGAIMTPVTSIGRPEAVYLYSGPDELYQRHHPALASLGGTASYLGTDPGRAASFDAALLDIFWTGVAGVAHGLALARAEGITGAELLPYAQGIVELMGEVAVELAKAADDGEHPGDEATLVSAAAGMTHVIHAAQARGIDASVLRAAVGLADSAIRAGHGEAGLGQIIESMYPRSTT